MTAAGVIPARWASTRLPGKVLADIGGKPLIQHVWERARQAASLSTVVIACDEPHVCERVASFGGKAVLTRRDHASGSDRIAEVAAGLAADIVVNIQGDEPFIDPGLIDALVAALAADAGAVMATAVRPIRAPEELADPNIVKAVLDGQGNALYFSRAGIPFHRDGLRPGFRGCYRHLGIYAYRKAFLLQFCRWPRSVLEQEEQLEQLRVLENGGRIRTVLTETLALGVDSSADLVRANELYAAQERQ